MNTPDIDEIRRLVQLFYDGATTPAQEAELCEWFRRTGRSELSDDLQADAEMFVAMSLSADVPSPPDDLARMLSEHIDASVRRRRRSAVWWVSMAAAAAVAVIFVALFPTVRYDGNGVPDVTLAALVAGVADAVGERQSPADTVREAVKEDIRKVKPDHRESVAQVWPAVKVAPAPVVGVADADIPMQREAVGPVVIDNPVKAAAVARRALRILAAAGQVAASDMRVAGESYGDIENLLTQLKQ